MRPDFNDKNKISRSIARRRLLRFTEQTMPSYQSNWHHKKLAQMLDQFVDKKIRNLIVSMPPRHGKSELVSRRLPAYILGRDPNANIISASYSADLSSRMNRDVQKIIDSPEYYKIFPRTRLSGKNIKTVAQGSWLRNSDIFEIVGHGGTYRSSGIGGGITGMGADYLIIDDPIKDMAEARSKRIRDSIWDWFISTAYTRIEKGGCCLITMTRWHEDDLVGRILDKLDGWDELVIPAISPEGEALWPDKYDIDSLNEIKSNVGSKVFTSLYQQDPRPDEGAMIKEDWLQYYDKDPGCESYMMSWDMAFKGSDKSDFVVGQVWGIINSQRYLIDQCRGRWDFPTTIEKFLSFTEKHPKAVRKIVEAKANGQAVIDTLKKHVDGIVPYSPKDSKESRLNAVAPLFEAGNVFLPKGRHWLDDYVGELLSFPYGANDDQVDASVQALLNLKSGASFGLVKK